MRYPKTLHLAGGKTVTIKTVFYPYAKNVYRVSYTHDGREVGLLAELFDGYWQETSREEVKQQYATPLKPRIEEYE